MAKKAAIPSYNVWIWNFNIDVLEPYDVVPTFLRELKKLIKETVRNRTYWWDMNYFCQHKDFYVFRDLEDCRNIIDWDILVY